MFRASESSIRQPTIAAQEERVMKWRLTAAMFSVLAYVVAPAPLGLLMAQDAPNVPLIPMTASELRAAGIAIQPAGAAPLPNSCAAAGAPELSVSDEMLAAFKSRGFSVLSLCIGLVSYSRFDPQTGKPMPIAEIAGHGEIPLNLPNCFHRAMPFSDCRFQFDHLWGGKHDQPRVKDLSAVGSAIDVIARKQMRAQAQKIFYPYNDCGNAKSPFTVVVGGTSVCVILERVVFSPGLPSGYGYALHSPEGDDPKQESVDLSTYRKGSQGLPFWGDEKSK
jgi:hypothetical protein